MCLALSLITRMFSKCDSQMQIRLIRLNKLVQLNLATVYSTNFMLESIQNFLMLCVLFLSPVAFEYINNFLI